MRYIVALLAIVLFSAPAAAQINNPSGVSQAALDAVAATVPTAATSLPPPEVVGGAVGTAGTYRPGTAVDQRITRATNCTLDATGSCSITWATALSANPTIVTTPINPPASQAIMCNTTATPTTTTAAIKCWTIQTTLLTLAIVTTGLTLAPAATAPAGTVVQVIAIPNTQ